MDVECGSRNTARVRRLGSAVAWAVVIGGVTGVVCRALMRVITLLGEQVPSFSLPVSAGIVLFFVLAVLPGAVAAAFTARWWRWLVAAPTTALLFAQGLAIASDDVAEAHRHVLSGAQWVGIYTGAAVILLLVVAQVVVAVRVVDARVRRAAPAGALSQPQVG